MNMNRKWVQVVAIVLVAALVLTSLIMISGVI